MNKFSTFFGTILSKVEGWFTVATAEVEKAVTSANGIVNILKTVAGSATAKTVEAVIEAFFPGVATPIFNAMNTFFTDWGIVSKDLTGSPAEIAAAGLNAIANLTGNSKAVALHNIAAIIGNAGDNALGGTSTIQHTLSVAAIVHNPDVLVGDAGCKAGSGA